MLLRYQFGFFTGNITKGEDSQVFLGILFLLISSSES